MPVPARRILFLNSKGGVGMEEQIFWQLFLDTGAPEAYLLHRRQEHQQEETAAGK